jgi:hypothetical protein
MTSVIMEWNEVFDLIDVDSVAALAAALGISRQALHNLRTLRHADIPGDLLKSLAKVARRHGMLDGSRAPSMVKLVKLWRDAKEDSNADS